MRVYIAGPMRGIPHDNFPAFNEAATLLRSLGHDVVSPAELDMDLGYMTTFAEYMRRDLEILTNVDAIYLLEGWRNSVGANVEVVAGLAMDLKFGRQPSTTFFQTDRPMPNIEMIGRLRDEAGAPA